MLCFDSIEHEDSFQGCPYIKQPCKMELMSPFGAEDKFVLFNIIQIIPSFRAHIRQVCLQVSKTLGFSILDVLN